MNRDGIPHSFKVILIGSLCVHFAAMIGAIVIGSFELHAAPPAPKNFIVTKLVKLGKKRPQHLLPTINRPPPPPKPAVSITPDPPPAAPKTTERPKPVSALERIKNLKESRRSTSNALDRLKKRMRESEGDPDGVEDGELTDAQKAVIGSKYATEIYRCLKKNYAVEGIDKRKVKGRSVTLLVKVRPNGKLHGAKLLKKSGVAGFDRAVVRSVNRCGKVSAPPDVLRDIVGEDGIEILYRP